jgi:hypothetical protein
MALLNGMDGQDERENWTFGADDVVSHDPSCQSAFVLLANHSDLEWFA